MSDAITELARRARDGDDAAAAAFVRATQGSVFRFVASLTDRGVAEDLVQETYLRAFRALDTFSGRATALTWVLAIARRVCVDHLRHRGRRLTAASLDDPGAGLAVPPTRFDVDATLAVADLLRGLDPDRHQAFVLTQLMGFSYQEAAQVCGCAVGTIRSRVHRARLDLIAAIDEPGSTSATG